MRRTRYSTRPEDVNQAKISLSHEDICTVETNDSLDIQFKIRVLSDLLVCPLCEGFFKDAVTIKECLHTFCKSCILLYLSNESEHCPVCQSDVGSNLEEALQSDVTIQNLVDKMFPHFSALEEQEKTQLRHSLRGKVKNTDDDDDPPNCLISSYEMDQNPMKNVESTNPLSDESNEQGVMVAPLGGWEATEEWFNHIMNPDTGLDFLRQYTNFSIALCAENRTDPFQKGFLRTSGKTQVFHLASYVAGKLGLEKSQVANVELTLEGQVLPHSHTLEFACRSRRLNTSVCIHLQFRFLPKKMTPSCITSD